MDAVRLRGDEDVFKGAEVRPNVTVVEMRITFRENDVGQNDGRFQVQDQGRDDQKRVTHDILYDVITEVGEEIQLSLGMMQRMKPPEEGHFVMAVVLQPVKEIH